MHVTIVKVHVKPEFVEQFIDATRINHKASIQEPGNLRFDVLQQADAEDHFILYEAYASEKDALMHKQTEHYLAWRDTVADWMASPRQGILHNGVFPEERTSW